MFNQYELSLLQYILNIILIDTIEEEIVEGNSKCSSCGLILAGIRANNQLRVGDIVISSEIDYYDVAREF